MQRIYEGNYAILGRKEGLQTVHGDFQLVASLLHFNGPKKQLYRLISVLFPWISLSYNTFRLRTVPIVHTQNRTDLCTVCYIHEEFMKKMRRKEEKHLSPTDQEIKFASLFQEHVKQHQLQRSRMRDDLAHLTVKQALILMDYKENIKIPILKNQPGREWYNKKQVTCLSFLVYKKLPDESFSKHVCTYFSQCLSHTGAFSLMCLEKLLKDPMFASIEEIILWSDGGPHFRCKELVGRVLSPRFEEGYHKKFIINYFAPNHGKSEIDSVFGLFAHILKDYLPVSGIDNITTLHEFFVNKFQQLNIGNDSTTRQYSFHMFVLTFSPAITLYAHLPPLYGVIPVDR